MRPFTQPSAAWRARPATRRSGPLAVLLLTLAGTMVACSSGGGTKVAVEGSNDACVPETTRLAAGKVTFEFRNTADDINELYVLDSKGGVVGEVENVTSGVTRQLTADLRAGTYELSCKPGMTGNGIRAAITVTSTGGPAST